MEEFKEKIYFADRWFYFDKVVNNRPIYCAKRNDRINNFILEINPDDKSLGLVIIKSKKTIGRLDISDITKHKVLYTFEQFEPEYIEINDTLYTNLIMKLYATIDDIRLIENNIEFYKKKKLNKMCYCEPDFPLETKIEPRVFDINSSVYDFFKDAYSNYSKYFSEIVQDFFVENKDSEIEQEKDIPEDLVRGLFIPNEIFVYDRNYHLVKNDVDDLVYKDSYSEANNLEIKLDLEEAKLKVVSFDKNENYRTNTQIYRDKSNNNKITIRFVNRKKVALLLNNKSLDHVKIHSEAVFDSNNKLETYSIEINAGIGNNYLLEHHPFFTNQFSDADGNVYHIRSGCFADYQSMIYYASGIFNNLESTFFPEQKTLVK